MRTMKLLAICLGAFVIATTSAANDKATMEVSAEIMETLTVRIDKHASFGRIAKGTYGNQAIGEYSIKGEGGHKANVVIEMPEDGRVRMEHISGAALYAVADHNLHTLQLVQDTFVPSRPIKYTLDVPDNAVGGVYTGNVLIKARYE